MLELHLSGQLTDSEPSNQEKGAATLELRPETVTRGALLLAVERVPRPVFEPVLVPVLGQVLVPLLGPVLRQVLVPVLGPVLGPVLVPLLVPLLGPV